MPSSGVIDLVIELIVTLAVTAVLSFAVAELITHFLGRRDWRPGRAARPRNRARARLLPAGATTRPNPRLPGTAGGEEAAARSRSVKPTGVQTRCRRHGDPVKIGCGPPSGLHHRHTGIPCLRRIHRDRQ